MALTRSEAANGLEAVSVWDWPVRIFHWLLVILIPTSWITSEIGGDAMTYHMWSGYTILTLIVFRVVWGFVGSRHARFGSFVAGPKAVLGYLSAGRNPGQQRYLGHNPLGAWSVVAMLASLLLQTSTGLFANDEIATEGPLASHVSGATSSLLTTIHGYNFYVLLTLVCVHILAIFYYLLVKRDNLIAAMFTGRKWVPAGEAKPTPTTSVWVALVVVAVIAGIVAAVVKGA